MKVTEGSYVSVLPAERPIEICVAVAEAVTAGAIFIKTASEGNLTRDAVPAQFVLSVDDTERKVNLYRRHQEIIETAKSSGVDTGLHQRVEQIEAILPLLLQAPWLHIPTDLQLRSLQEK